MDYQSNAKKNKEESQKVDKNIQRVVSGEVIIQKKSLGRKFLDLFVVSDIKSVMRYIVSEVLLPAARNTIVDASSKGVQRMMYGESAMRRTQYGAAPRITYNNPINRDYARPIAAPGLPVRTARFNQTDFILASREEAELVLEQMNNIIDQYQIVSVADLNALIGVQSSHVDNKWGWQYLLDVPIRQSREGFIIDLPQAEPI